MLAAAARTGQLPGGLGAWRGADGGKRMRIPFSEAEDAAIIAGVRANAEQESVRDKWYTIITRDAAGARVLAHNGRTRDDIRTRVRTIEREGGKPSAQPHQRALAAALAQATSAARAHYDAYDRRRW